MKIKTLVILLLIIVGVVYGGLKGTIYYKVKQQADTLVSAAAPFADIRYGSIGSTWDGVIHINNIAVSPRGVTEIIGVEQLRIITPGLKFILTDSDSMSRGELPERFGLQLQGVLIRLEGSLVNKLEKLEAEQTKKQPLPGDVCTLSRAFTTAQYRELGIKKLVLDTDFLIERGDLATDMRMTMLFALREIEQAKFSMTLTGIGNTVYSVANLVPLLKNASASYRPAPEFVNARLEYCSKKQKTDIPTFINQVFDKNDAYYVDKLGFIPGPGIRDALKKLVQGQGELAIVAKPLSPVNMNTVHLYQSSDWQKLFGLSMLIDNTAVTDLSFRIPKRVGKQEDSGKTLFEFLGIGKKTPAEDKKQTSDKSVQKKPKQKKGDGYRIASTKEIYQFVGKEVRIVTYEGKQRNGRILDAEEGRLTLEKRTRGGTFSSKVYIGAIKKIEVKE